VIKVLQNIRVIEQGTFITGPATGMLLGDLGADVIKVEQPGTGDPFRAFRGGLYSPHFQTYNRNKRSVTLNTKDAGDLAAFDELIRTADVYIQNFRPGAAARLNVDEARLRAINPRLIYCSISGFGQSGPSMGRPAYDTVAQAASGFLGLLVNPENPRVVGPAIADSITGFYAAYGILGALQERARTGTGLSVEVSMLEAMTHFAVEPFAAYFALGQTPTSADRPKLAQAYILRTADERLLAIHLSSLEKFWEGLVAALEAPELATDPRFNPRERRIAEYETLRVELNKRFSRKPLAHWMQRLQAEDVPHAPVNRLEDVVSDPQVAHLGIVVPVDSAQTATRAVRPPVQFDRERAQSVEAAPLLDQHGATIRAALGRGEVWPMVVHKDR